MTARATAPAHAKKSAHPTARMTAASLPAASPLRTAIGAACACGGGCPRCGSVLRRKTRAATPPAIPASVHGVLASHGKPLEPQAREFMEQRFERDFSGVRIHDDPAAARSAEEVAASAYAVGAHVDFARGEYAPRTGAGRALLAHELAHVAQSGADGAGALRVGESASAEEHVADRAAAAVAQSGAMPAIGPAAGRVLRRADAPVCSASQLQDLGDMGQTAAFMIVQPAIDKLSDYKPENKALARALFRSFNLTDDVAGAKVPIIRSRLESIKRILDRVGQSTPLCATSAAEGFCTRAAAFIEDLTKITYCPVFFTFNKDSRFDTLIHECAHAVDSSIIDRGYTDQRIFARLSVEEAMTNAESYSRLVMELAEPDRPDATRSFAAFEFAADQYAGCDTPARSLLVSAIALAEKYNADTDMTLSGTDPSQITDQKKFDDFKRYFSEAKKIFGKSLTVRCAAKAEECHGGFIRYIGGAVVYCPSQAKDPDPATTAFRLLNEIYDAIAGGPGNFSAYQASVAAVRLSAERTPPIAPAQSANPAPAAPSAAATRKEVKRGDKGCPIPELQEKLAAAGQTVTVSGLFDAATETAVTAFQKSKALTSAKAGAADASTWASLQAAAPGNHGLPTGEKFVKRAWRTGDDDTIFDWDQELTPANVDFSGCEVKEEDPGGGQNGCCTQGQVLNKTCMTTVTGGQWTVGAAKAGAKSKASSYGPDAVGLTRPVVDAARSRRLAPCSYTIPQRMVVVRPEGNAAYVTNELRYSVTKDEITCGKSNAAGSESAKKKG